MVGGPARAGLLVAFEGIDGCGKSTQIERSRAWLSDPQGAGRDVVLLREPGGTDLGERVREVVLHGGSCEPLTEMLLYMASRAELYRLEVLPALSTGRVVLLDRSHYSTAAYQGAGLGLDEQRILDLASWVTDRREPDLIVLLDVPVDVAEARRTGGARSAEAADEGDRIERRGAEYFERVRAAYLGYAARDPSRFLTIDARGAPDEVARQVREGLQNVL